MEKYAIVVGGTGMLKGVTLWLAEQGYKVFVIGRRQEKLESVVNEGGKGRIVPISVDYHDDDSFRTHISDIIKVLGSVEIVVSWIHSSAPFALNILLDEVTENTKNKWFLFHIRGSSAAFLPKMTVSVPNRCIYHQILLGFVIENEQSRWLTHKEISGGVINAIKENLKYSVIGTIEPWEKRP